MRARAFADALALQPPLYCSLRRLRKAQQLEWTAAHQHLAALEVHGAGVHLEAELGWYGCGPAIRGVRQRCRGGCVFPGRRAHRGNLGREGTRDRLAARSKEKNMLTEEQDVQEVEALSDDEVDELLVEEVSIDGMCGVY